MERQYIGARYVPKFWDNGSGSTEWTPNIPYESMIVVTYMNNSYTSKVPVPATQVTPNIDTEHWVLTGAYNAQVEQYRQVTEEVKESVKQLEIQIENINPDSFFGSKAMIIGDSLNLENGWGVKLKEIASLDAVVIGNGSAGFVSKGRSAPYSGMDILETVQAATSSMTTEEKNTFDYIIVGCGQNDIAADVSTLTANTKAFFAYIKANFHNAKVFFFLDHTFEAMSIKAKTNYEAINAAALSENVVVNYDLMLVTFDNLEWSDGSVHMTADGYLHYAEKILNAIIGGDVLEDKLVNITAADSAFYIDQNRSTIKGGILHLSFIITFTATYTAGGRKQMFTNNHVSSDIGHGWTHCMVYNGGAATDSVMWLNPGGGAFQSAGEITAGTDIYVDMAFDSTIAAR